MPNCIAVLTRGYTDIADYNKLIKRNTHISRNLNDKSMDILIFHEGNITQQHQLFIRNGTPELNLKFIDISNIGFQAEKQNIRVEEAHGFPINYRHMCSFWFVDFHNAVKDYDKMLRIDEDCFLESSIDDIFEKLDHYLFICGRTIDDDDSVTIGLNAFSLDFVEKHKSEFVFKKTETKYPSGGPYTNVMGVSLERIRNIDIVKKYIDETDRNEMIYKRRWGDLPLWGEVIHYICGDDSLKVDSTIKYYHESHSFHVT